MLQTLRERRCVEDVHENSWKTRAKIWVDAEVASEACQVRNQAEAQNGNWIETHFENSATQTSKTDHSRTYCCFKSRAPTTAPQRPRKSKQPPVDTSPFAAPARLTDPDLDKKSP